MTVTGHARIAVCVDDDAGAAPAIAEACRPVAPGGTLVVHALATAGPGVLASPTMAPPPLREPTPHARALPEGLPDTGVRDEPVVPAGDDPAGAVRGWAAGEGRPDRAAAAAVRGRRSRAVHGSFTGHLACHAPRPVRTVHHGSAA